MAESQAATSSASATHEQPSAMAAILVASALRTPSRRRTHSHKYSYTNAHRVGRRRARDEATKGTREKGARAGERDTQRRERHREPAERESERE